MALGLGTIKNVWDMKKKGEAMQAQMKAITIKGSSKSGKITVTMDGTQEIIDLQIADELLNPQMKDVLVKEMKEAFKNAQENLQKDMAKNMDMDQIKEMMKGLG